MGRQFNMRRISFLFIIFLIVFVSACSQDHKSIFIGTWKAVQASQSAESNEEIGNYNYLIITSSNLSLQKSHEEVGSDKSAKVIIENEKNVAYKWISKDQILIDNKQFKVELKKNEMKISNNNIEIQYIKE
jgi:hypothetical protein